MHKKTQVLSCFTSRQFKARTMAQSDHHYQFIPFLKYSGLGRTFFTPVPNISLKTRENLFVLTSC